MTDSFIYQGNELLLFQHAINWKNYFSKQIKPFIKGNVLEVGAGIGSTTLLLNDVTVGNWLMLEPDEEMAAELKTKLDENKLPGNCQIQTGTIAQVTSTFDTIIYIDVLEHIEKDAAEMNKAASLLNTGGHIIVLSPAFPFLYSPFDKTIGHHRRYNKKMFLNITPPSLQLVSSRYYDSAGFFASLMNKLILRKNYPTQKQVLFWDRWMVPVSNVTDNIFLHNFGKCIIGIWKKPV